MIAVAKIAGAHGVKGAVKLSVFIGAGRDIFAMPLAFADGREARLSFVGRGNSPDKLIAAVEGVNDREAAGALRGAELFTSRENLVSEDEILLDELVGFSVDGGGIVSGWANHGAGDILEIAFTGGRSGLVLLAHVNRIDREAKNIEVDRDFLV